MVRYLVLAAAVGTMVIPANAQPGPHAQPGHRQLTFFSNNGFTGRHNEVLGTHDNLRLPFNPRSVTVVGGGGWELCGNRNHRAPCETINSSQRNLRLPFRAIQSVRPLPLRTPQPVWLDIARFTVRDRLTGDTAVVRDNRAFRQVMFCAEQGTLRLGRAEAQLDGRNWQPLPVPDLLTRGNCSRPIDLPGNGRRITSLRVTYRPWLPIMSGGVLVVRGLPFGGLIPPAQHFN